MGEYLAGAFGKFAEWQWYVIAAVVLLVLFAVAMLMAGRKVKWNTRMLSSAAMCIALSFVLGAIKLYSMPQGGSITPGSMLPVILFGMAYGVWPGVIVGAAWGLLDLLQSMYVVHPMQLLLDYPIAFAMMGLGALVRKQNWGILRLPAAVLIACVGRYACAVISGAVFFAEYAGDMNPWIYSLTYNVTYMGPETLVTMALAFIPQIAGLERVVRGTDKKLRAA
ncbi:MAG: energy-coupled thiamine transporter ThiT [Candidatus Fimadaptatus sp.]|jgi:thiamine transporter